MNLNLQIQKFQSVPPIRDKQQQNVTTAKLRKITLTFFVAYHRLGERIEILFSQLCLLSLTFKM